MPNNITESDTFTTTLQTPVGGEAASAGGLLGLYLQPAANRLRWLYNRVSVFVSGGTLSPADNVLINTPTTKTVKVNDLTTASHSDGGAVTVANAAPLHATGTLTVDGLSTLGTIHGSGTAQLEVVNGVGAGGLAGLFQNAVIFSNLGRVVTRTISQVGSFGMTASIGTASRYFFPSAAPSSSIQINDSGTGVQDGDTLYFSTLEAANPIEVKDPGGSTLAFIQYTHSATIFHAIEVTHISGSWVVTTKIGMPAVS